MRRSRGSHRRSSPRFAITVLLGSIATPALAGEASEDPFATPTPPTEAAKPAAKARAKLEDATTKRATLEVAAYSDSDHVMVLSPSVSMSVENVTSGASMHASYLVDVVSAASVDIVSTASRAWHEVRHVGSFDVEYKPHDFGIAVGGSVSDEPDYLSVSGGVTITKDFDEKNTTILGGYGYGHDTVGRSTTPFAVFSRTVDRGTFNLGLTQVIDRATIATLAGDLVIEHGDQSKPYRYVPMFSAAVASKVPLGASIGYVTANRLYEGPLEQLPLERRRAALTGRLAHRFDGSTLRGEERIYLDDWGLLASTTDARWIFDASRRLELWPHARMNLQSAVGFWKRAYVSDPTTWSVPEYRTGDRELGPLRTFTGGLGARWLLGSDAAPQAWSLSAQADGMYTQFLDDLYLTHRTGVIGSITLEGEL